MTRGTIVFAFNAMRLGGSQTVIRQLVRGAAAEGFAPVVASRPGPLAGEFAAAGAQVVPLFMREGSACDRGPTSLLKNVASLGAITRLASIGRSGRVVVHAAQPWPVAFSALGCLVRGSPLIWHAHGTTAVEAPAAWLPLVRRASAAWVAVTPEVEEALIALGPRSSTKVATIPSPIDLNVPQHERARSEAGVIGIVSTLTPNKAEYVRTCVSAAAIVAARRGPITVVVVGDGPERRGIEEMAAATEMEAPSLRVRFLGASVQPWELLRPASAIVGMGLVALEAAIRGHAVVCASNYGRGGPLSIESYTALSGTNFTGRGIGPLDPSGLAIDLAAALDAGPDAQLEAHIRRERGPRAIRQWVEMWTGVMS